MNSRKSSWSPCQRRCEQCVFFVWGNNHVREAMHSAFLYHAVKSRMDVDVQSNYARSLRWYRQDAFRTRRRCIARWKDQMRQIVYLNGRITQRRLKKDNTKEEEEWKRLCLKSAWNSTLVKGITKLSTKILRRLRIKYGIPLHVIEGPLMAGMNVVGFCLEAEKCSCHRLWKVQGNEKSGCIPWFFC